MPLGWQPRSRGDHDHTERTDLDAPTRSFEPYDSVRADARFGLTLSRAVVESHGGRIWVAPYLDRGTVLQFELPIETPKTN